MVNIDNLYDLSETITAVVNRVLETVTENTSTGQYYVGYDDVSDLISEEDYLQYFDLIAFELQGREEVLDLDMSDHEFDVNCGLAWCKNYEPLPDEDFVYGYEELRAAPSMARLAEIGQKALEHLVLEDARALFKPEDLGISPVEVEYVRNNIPAKAVGRDDVVMTRPLAAKPVTTESYENLIIGAEIQRDQLRGHDPLAQDTPIFQTCVNIFGQIANEALLSQYPRAKEFYERIFSEKAPSGIARFGAVVNGTPSLILCQDVFAPTDDPHLRDAMSALQAGQLRSMFAATNVHITYSRGTGDNGQNELLAIIPTTAPVPWIRDFEQKFANAKDSLPFSWAVAWSQRQYEALQNAVKTELSQHKMLPPWVTNNPDTAAVHACGVLGEYIGEHHQDWVMSGLTNNHEKRQQLITKFDVTACPETLAKATIRGIYEADQDLSRRICLYTNYKHTESFTVPKGQLALALKEMDCDADFGPLEFLRSYDPALAQEVRSVVEDLPKIPLSLQMEMANQRKAEQDKGEYAPAKDKDRDI